MPGKFLRMENEFKKRVFFPVIRFFISYSCCFVLFLLAVAPDGVPRRPEATSLTSLVRPLPKVYFSSHRPSFFRPCSAFPSFLGHHKTCLVLVAGFFPLLRSRFLPSPMVVPLFLFPRSLLLHDLFYVPSTLLLDRNDLLWDGRSVLPHSIFRIIFSWS